MTGTTIGRTSLLEELLEETTYPLPPGTKTKQYILLAVEGSEMFYPGLIGSTALYLH